MVEALIVVYTFKQQFRVQVYGTITLSSPSSEPVRQLIGIPEAELQQLAAYLPKGGSIATFPVGETQTRAAKAVAALDKTGRVLTVLVYSIGGRSEPLELGVFAFEDGKLTKLASTKLPGSYIYTNIYDRFAALFGMADVNGDGLPEIVVTSSQGASLGAQLRSFPSTEKTSTRLPRWTVIKFR
ncbi:MAG: VCBS repeat-containing protein [Acidobacteria bacterium]|nr:VCBS repeat-containing protein [Acidobacteriota bacterium]